MSLRAVPIPADAPPALELLERAIPDLSDLDVSPETITRLAALQARLGALLAGAAGLAMARASRPVQTLQPDRLLDSKETAKAIGMSVEFVRDHRAELGVTYQGAALRFSSRAVAAYIQRGQAEAAKAVGR